MKSITLFFALFLCTCNYVHCQNKDHLNAIVFQYNTNKEEYQRKFSKRLLTAYKKTYKHCTPDSIDSMKKNIENINVILADWDPIGLGIEMAADEYKGYIPSILSAIEDKQQLKRCLEDILINKMGVKYDRTNKKHSEDLDQVCDKIIQTNLIY